MVPSAQLARRSARISSADTAPSAAAWRAISANCIVMLAEAPHSRRASSRNKLKLTLPALSQRLHAGGAVDCLAVAGPTRFDVSRDGLRARAQRKEKHDEHAGLAGELQLARVALAHVESRLPETTHQTRRILLDHRLEAGSPLDLRWPESGHRRIHGSRRRHAA